jgi:hypothetical protein
MKHRLAPRWIDETLPAVIRTKTTSRKPQPPKRDAREAGRGWVEDATAQALFRREPEGFPQLFWPDVLDQSPIALPFTPC